MKEKSRPASWLCAAKLRGWVLGQNQTPAGQHSPGWFTLSHHCRGSPSWWSPGSQGRHQRSLGQCQPSSERNAITRNRFYRVPSPVSVCGQL